jgi:hypothetical protein
MNRFALITLLIFPIFVYSQKKDKRHIIEYLNMSSISIGNNSENYFSDYGLNDEKKNGTSVSFEINTIQGVKLFEIVSVSTGISLDWNINKTFLSTPYILDLRVFSSRSNQNGLFAYIQTGKNIKWSDSFNGNGVTAKFGIGVLIKENKSTSLYFDLFNKSKEIQTEEFEKRGYYNINSYGISFGMIFN